MYKEFNMIAYLFISLMVFDNAYAMKTKPLDEQKQNEPTKKRKLNKDENQNEKLPFEAEAAQLSPGYLEQLDLINIEFLKIKRSVPNGIALRNLLDRNMPFEDYFHLECPEWQVKWKKLLGDFWTGEDYISPEEIVDLLLGCLPAHWVHNIYFLLASPYFVGFHSHEYISKLFEKYSEKKLMFYFYDNLFYKVERGDSGNLFTTKFRFCPELKEGEVKDDAGKVIDIENIVETIKDEEDSLVEAFKNERMFSKQ